MENVPCAICEQDQTTLLFSKWGHNIVRCRQCDLAYVNPRSFNVESDDYFRGPYLSTIEENGALNPGIEHLYSGILSNLGAYLNPGRLLDVGSALGHFMVRAREAGWSVHGVECSMFAANYGYERWGLHIQPVCDLRMARLPNSHFDACVMIEVAEHLPHPLVTMKEAFRLLKPGGLLYITTPNFASFRALLSRDQWRPIIPTGHLYYFTPDSITKLLRAAGFQQIVNLTSPAHFDTELEIIRSDGRLAVTSDELEEVRRWTAEEDRSSPVNARGEGLIVCGIKPRLPHSAGMASLRFTKPMPPLEGYLVCAPGSSPDEQKVYLIWQGRKHWVTSVDWLEKHGMRLQQTVQVEQEALDSIMAGPPLM